MGDYEDDVEGEIGYCQWDHDEVSDMYSPLSKLNIKNKLENGYYDIITSPQGIHFEKMDIRLDGLVDFGKGVCKKITEEINTFWESEKKFREVNKSVKILYKRGILMYGPPGCGKSSLISMVMSDIIKRNGIALSFGNVHTLSQGIDVIRKIQPNTKILVVMEDIDSYIERHGEADILNMLDGADTVLDSVIFLATSNFKHKLSTRLLRPSRFDLKIELNYPDVELRKRYLSDLFKSIDYKNDKILNKIVKDTEGFSFADLKELFISTRIFNYSYEDSLNSLKNSAHVEDNSDERDDIMFAKAVTSAAKKFTQHKKNKARA